MSHFTRKAVALAYGKNPVPVVTAKGDFISEDPQLLALLSRLNVDEEIPRELYTAVAVVLSWVYWLKDMRPGDEKDQAA